MINSLFMLGSSYNKNRLVSVAFLVGWIAYMFIGSNLSLGATFPIINAITFLAITILINLVKNKKANTILSIFSILIWSITIDTICYFVYPMMVGNQNIFAYVFQGILFNGKYILSNMVAIGVIYAFDFMLEKIKKTLKKEQYIVNT